jgi:lysophospholipase L1-like esterase
LKAWLGEMVGKTSSSASWFERHPKKTLLFTILGILSLITVSCEIVLKRFFPFATGTIGHLNAAHSLAYGWGYNPRELMRTLDPDTGEVYISPLNNNGWRDRDRSYENRDHSFRIIIIGDSVTFGAIVPEDKTYSRILENKLRAEGYNVEVINIAYSGWDTDQELEALKREGLLYKPGLVISQFCTNDLDSFACLSDEAKKSFELQRPFYYKLDENNTLIKCKNDLFYLKYGFWYAVKAAMLKSEILKRCYYFLSIYKLKKEGINIMNQNSTYSINDNALNRFRLVFGIEQNDDVIAELKKNNHSHISRNKLMQIISACNKVHDLEKALRIFEDRWFNLYWSEANFRGRQPNPKQCQWKLYFALIKEMDRLARENGADLAIFSENDLGHYEWEVYWGRVEDSDIARKNYLSPTTLIKEFAQREKISMVPNRNKYTRARNDPHPNIRGNMAMAEDLYIFLKENYSDKLEQYRIK